MKSDILFPEKHYVIFDLETTGIDPYRDKVIQIAAIKVFGGIEQPAFASFIKIEDRLPEKIKELTGITDEMLQEKGGDAQDVWSEFAAYIGNYSLIGHNVINFDRIFLETAFEKYGITAPNKFRYLDTAMLYKARKLKENQRWYENHYSFAQRISEIRSFGVRFNLALCCQEMGIDTTPYQAHRADSDVQMTNKVYQQLLKDGLIYEEIRPSIVDLQKKTLDLAKKQHVDKLIAE